MSKCVCARPRRNDQRQQHEKSGRIERPLVLLALRVQRVLLTHALFPAACNRREGSRARASWRFKGDVGPPVRSASKRARRDRLECPQSGSSMTAACGRSSGVLSDHSGFGVLA